MNNKFNILRLNGWSGEVTSDMERYNRPLSKIYQRYWRKGSVSPFLELGFLLFGSLIVHHFKNLLMGGASMSPQPPPTRVSSSAQSRNVPFNFANTSNGNNSNVPQTKRKTMRRPKRAQAQDAGPSPTMQETNVPPPNLINQILQQQTQPFQQNGTFMNRPSGQNIGIIGVGVVPVTSSINQAPNHIMIDVEEKRSRKNNDPLELEILDESNNQKENDEHRIDIKDENTLSFDM